MCWAQSTNYTLNLKFSAAATFSAISFDSVMHGRKQTFEDARENNMRERSVRVHWFENKGLNDAKKNDNENETSEEEEIETVRLHEQSEMSVLWQR